MNWQEELELAKTAAKRAGEYLLKAQNEPIQVVHAEGRDIKLQADKESEKIIMQILMVGSPYALLTEESGEHGPARPGDPVWIVDPLDGSLNFSRHIPSCCVSIGLWHADKPILGVVYDFNRDELFSGVVEIGAWCNERGIKVTKEKQKNKAILATGFPVYRDFSSSSLRAFLSSIQKFKKIRLFGSAALSLAYVASGRVDAYIEEGIMLWDVAAGLALVLASGGWFELKKSKRNIWARYVRCAANEKILQSY